MTDVRLRKADHPWWRRPSRRGAGRVNIERCEGKIAHPYWREAEEHLLELIEQDHRLCIPEASLGLASYRCSNCGCWHVGHGVGTHPKSQGLRKSTRLERAPEKLQ